MLQEGCHQLGSVVHARPSRPTQFANLYASHRQWVEDVAASIEQQSSPFDRMVRKARAWLRGLRCAGCLQLKGESAPVLRFESA